MRDIKQMGVEVELVLADSLYGESESNFLGCLEELKLNFIVAIRRNYGVWLPKGQRVRCNRWHASRTPLRSTGGPPAHEWLLNGGNPRMALALKFDRTFSDGTCISSRCVREIVFGKKRSRRYWELTTEPETLPEKLTWYVMTEIPDVKYKDIGDLYGCMNWV